MRQPLLIFVSGAPGAGKTTLAYNIAQHLRIPHIPRDEIMRGVEMTHGQRIDKAVLGIEIYYSMLVHMLEAGISLVTDGTIYRGISEQDIKKYLVKNSSVINLHVTAENEYQRFVEREKRREGWSDDWVRNHKIKLDEIYHQAVDPLDLGVPLIDVDASDDYDPSIMEIIRRIRKIYRDTRLGIKEG